MHGVEKQELMQHFLGSAGRSAHPTLETWCPTTKEQGLAGSKAPRPTCRRPIRPQRRGAPRRRNKGSRGAEHHAHLAGAHRRRTLPPATAQPGAGGHSNSDGRALAPGTGDRKVRTSGAGMVSNPSAAGGPTGRHPHPAPPGRSLIQIGARPAGRSAHLRPAPRLVCNSKVGKSKNRGCPRAVPVLSAFVILICKPAAVQDSFPS